MEIFHLDLYGQKSITEGLEEGITNRNMFSRCENTREKRKRKQSGACLIHKAGAYLHITYSKNFKLYSISFFVIICKFLHVALIHFVKFIVNDRLKYKIVHTRGVSCNILIHLYISLRPLNTFILC